MFKTKEYPPNEEGWQSIIAYKSKSFISIIKETLLDIYHAIKNMPLMLQRLSVVYLFQWYAMFVYWQFVTPMFKKILYNISSSDEKELQHIKTLCAKGDTITNDQLLLAQTIQNKTELALVDTGLMNGTYNFITMIAALLLVPIAIKIGSKITYGIALMATGSFVTAESTGNAAYGSLIEGASSIINGLFADADSNLQLGLDYSQGNRLTEISDRVGVTLSTRISDRITINGKANVPVGGVTESIIVGNLEVLIQLNEDGSLNAHVFNRENDINYVGDGIGYTQGLGVTYNVEFNTFREMLKKIFNSNRNRKKTSKSHDDLPDSDFPNEFIEFINQRKFKSNNKKYKK